MTNKIIGLLSVKNKAGQVIFSQPILDDKPTIWKEYIDAYGSQEIEKLPWPVVFIPEEAARWVRTKPLSCLYTATKGLLRNMWGLELDRDDEAFFDEHPLATVAGVGLPNTLRVVQELIDPYNFRVSRVHLMPGTPIPGDLAQWVDVLGMNPIAIGDHATSNEMFAQLTGQDPAVVDKTYKMEYTQRSLRPCILCAVAPMRADNKTGENLGHAEYVGARAKRQGHEPTMQVQVDRGNFVHWYQNPVFPPVADGGSQELSLWQTLDPTGEPMSRWYQKHWQENKKTGFSRASSPANTGEGTTYLRLLGDGNFECFICYEKKANQNRVGAALCQGCWDALWKRYNCAVCDASLVRCRLTGLKMTDDGKKNPNDGPWILRINCPKCSEPNELTVLKGTMPYRVVQAIRNIKVVVGA